MKWLKQKAEPLKCSDALPKVQVVWNVWCHDSLVGIYRGEPDVGVME
jgi:hypothetical protein